MILTLNTKVQNIPATEVTVNLVLKNVRKNPCLRNPISSSPHPSPPPPPFHWRFLDLPLVWCPVGVSSVSSDNSYLMGIFFFTCSRWSAGGANGKQRNKTTTSGKRVVPLCCLKIWHEFYFRDWQSSLYFVGTIFSSLPIPIWYTPEWREAQHNDLSKSWTQTCQTGGHLANHWTTGSLMKRGGGSWIHYDLKLS